MKSFFEKTYLSGIFFLTVSMGLTSSASAFSVWTVDSYDPGGFEWTREARQGFIEGLSRQGLKESVDYDVRYDTLDALVNASSYAKQHAADRIVTAIHKAPPDFVICNDDDAIQWVCLRLEVPSVIILSGISGDPGKYLLQNKIDSLTLPGHNITGVYRTSVV